MRSVPSRPKRRLQLLVALLAASPAPVIAQTSTATSALPGAYVLPAEGARTVTWYGWETLSFDASLGVALLATAAVLAHQESNDLWLIPVGLPYIAATPIVHAVHDNLLGTLISGAIRLIVPASTFAIIRATCEGRFCRDSKIGNQAALWSGFALSLFLAPLVDAALFAWEER